MKASMELLVRGLLVLALGGYAIGCGDDSSSDSKGDSGVDSGAPAGGTGGKTMDKDSGTPVGKPDVAMCSAAATKLADPRTPAACVTCACTKDAKATTACDAMCWGLIGCVVEKCAGKDPAVCAPTMCTAFLSGAVPAMALGTVLTGMCTAECTVDVPGGDGGVDAGN